MTDTIDRSDQDLSTKPDGEYGLRHAETDVDMPVDMAVFEDCNSSTKRYAKLQTFPFTVQTNHPPLQRRIYRYEHILPSHHRNPSLLLLDLLPVCKSDETLLLDMPWCQGGWLQLCALAMWLLYHLGLASLELLC